jgi:hypothetical protein
MTRSAWPRGDVDYAAIDGRMVDMITIDGQVAAEPPRSRTTQYTPSAASAT